MKKLNFKKARLYFFKVMFIKLLSRNFLIKEFDEYDRIFKINYRKGFEKRDVIDLCNELISLNIIYEEEEKKEGI